MDTKVKMATYAEAYELARTLLRLQNESTNAIDLCQISAQVIRSQADKIVELESKIIEKD